MDMHYMSMYITIEWWWLAAAYLVLPFVIADLNGTARIEPGPFSWHTSALTTELQEVMQ